MTSQEAAEKLATLTEEAEPAELLFAAERSIELIQAYCGIAELPAELSSVCLQLALCLYHRQESGVASLKQGEFSIVFSPESETERELVAGFSTELDRFRRMNW